MKKSKVYRFTEAQFVNEINKRLIEGLELELKNLRIKEEIIETNLLTLLKDLAK